jgi:mannose-6-phosphate isomerase
MNRLYPLKFKPIIKDKIWGGTRLKKALGKNSRTSKAGESWEISSIPGSLSKVRNGFLAGNTLEEIIEVYMGDLVGDRIFEEFGTLFPLLIKFIDANDRLSVQVHPEDELALKQFGSFGKTEMWYIIEAEQDAEIVAGFSQNVNAEIYRQHLHNGSLMEILNSEKTVAGDVFFLPAGRIHAIGAGILLAEIQQTSDATLRIFDYNRMDDKGKPRELHTDMALQAIDFRPVNQYKTPYAKNENETNPVVSCKYFTTNYLDLVALLEKDYHLLDSFVIYLCVEGSFTIRYYNTEMEPVKKGETILLPAEIKSISLIPNGRAKLLEVYAGDYRK